MICCVRDLSTQGSVILRQYTTKRIFGAFDLHSNNNHLAIIDEEDSRISRRKLPNQADVIFTELEPYKDYLAGIVVEPTFNWYWLVDLLMDEGYRIHLANPVGIQKYKGLQHADDSHDAFWLAHLLRLGILLEGYIYQKEERPVRDLLRKRGHLVRLTSIINSLQAIIYRNCGAKIGTNKIKAKHFVAESMVQFIGGEIRAVCNTLRYCRKNTKKDFTIPTMSKKGYMIR